LCANLLAKDPNLILEWTKLIAKDASFNKDKLSIQFIFCGSADTLESKLSDLKELIKSEKVIMTKEEFLDHKFDFEELLENGKEDG